MTHTPPTPANPAQGGTTENVDEALDQIEGACGRLELVWQNILASSHPGNPTVGLMKEAIFTIRKYASAAIGAGGQAVAYQWRKRDRVMVHEENWSYVDYHTGLKIAEHPEKYEVRPLYTRPAPNGQAVAVKALEWRGSEGVWHKADAEFGGHYRITQYVGMQKPFKLETHGWWSGSPCGHYELLDEAKAAAQADYERRILSALTHPAPQQQGWQLVPVEPTEAMLNAAPASFSDSFKAIWPQICGDIYRAMLSAAPQPTSEGE